MKAAECYSICCYSELQRERHRHVGFPWSSCKKADMQIKEVWLSWHAWSKSHIVKHNVYEHRKGDCRKEGLVAPSSSVIREWGHLDVDDCENKDNDNNNDNSIHFFYCQRRPDLFIITVAITSSVHRTDTKEMASYAKYAHLVPLYDSSRTWGRETFLAGAAKQILTAEQI